jgi:peptide/nickel transport system permease protein
VVERAGTTAAGTGEGLSPLPLVGRFANLALTLTITFIGLTAITFIIGRVMPADPVLAIVGDRASKEVYEAMYLKLGLDKPILLQYWIYVSSVLQGDFGKSIMTTQPVLDDIIRFFPATFELASVATVLGLLFGIPMGVVAAVRQGRLTDHIVRVVGLFGYSVPIFWRF